MFGNGYHLYRPIRLVALDLSADHDIVHDHNYHIINGEHNIVEHDHNYGIQNEINDNDGAIGIESEEHNNHVVVARPQTYSKVFGVQRSTEKILDNLGFLYHKNKETQFKIYLVCVEKKLVNRCRATATISVNRNDNSIVLLEQHNHLVRPFNREIPLLRQEITKKCLEHSIHAYTPRNVYNESIVNFPNALLEYTFVQADERMRRLRRKSFSPTPWNIENLHVSLMAVNSSQFSETLQSPPNRFYQGPLLVDGIVKGL